MNFDAAVLAYIRTVLAERKLSVTALAKQAGISPSTLTRALNDPNHKFTLSMKTIEKVAAASGINPAPYLQAENVADLNTNWLVEPNLYNEEIWGRGANGDATNLTHVVGDVGAGLWVQPSVLPIEEAMPLFITHVSAPPNDCFACRVRGESADLIAVEGEYVFCTRHRRQSGPPPFHQASVVVERRSRDAFKIELSARFLRRVGNDWELSSAASADQDVKGRKKYFETVVFENFHFPPDMTILGTIQYVVRRPPR